MGRRHYMLVFEGYDLTCGWISIVYLSVISFRQIPRYLSVLSLLVSM